MIELVIYNEERVSEIAKVLSLDHWWVKSVIVEYFDCRRYAENDKLWTFDFGIITQNEINQIPYKKVIIPNYYLVQNIRPYDLEVRVQLVNARLPFVPMEDSEIFPEGLANKTCFQGFGNSIDVWDHKLEFNQRAVIRDDGNYYQWKVAETLEMEGRNHWYKSDICELDHLYEINQEIQKFRKLPLLKKPTSKFVLQVSEIYKKLEVERSIIRRKILEYHDRKKTDFDPKNANVPDPPILSYFETVKPVKNGYHVRTHMEPLFLRSAIRHKELARKAREKRGIDKDKPNHDALLDEIEHSAMCIISATNCLESYINYIIKKYLPNKESEVFENVSLGVKWLYVPLALELHCKFDPEQSPFKNFSSLVGLRNRVIHHKPEYVKSAGTTSKVVNQFNLDNAILAIKVVKDMVTALSSDRKIPMPQWIKTYRAGAAYWDEVSACLRDLKT